MLRIQVQGEEHSGKGYAIAAIARALRELGAEVAVQGEESHNRDKLAKPTDAVARRLAGQRVVVTELQTARQGRQPGDPAAQA